MTLDHEHEAELFVEDACLSDLRRAAGLEEEESRREREHDGEGTRGKGTRGKQESEREARTRHKASSDAQKTSLAAVPRRRRLQAACAAVLVSGDARREGGGGALPLFEKHLSATEQGSSSARSSGEPARRFCSRC